MSDYESVGSLPASVEKKIEEAVEKVRDRVQKGQSDPNFNAPADPYDIAERTNDILQGAHLKRPEVWKQVMEAHGFKWYEPSELDRVVGKEKYRPSKLEGLEINGVVVDNQEFYLERSHKVGQWRRPKQAFTIADLFAGFGHPEEFDRWIREMEQRKLRARFGLK